MAINARGKTPPAELFSSAPAGTLVDWDVDPVETCVRVYRADRPVTFRAGEIADAEPAVPGWRFAIDLIVP